MFPEIGLFISTKYYSLEKSKRQEITFLIRRSIIFYISKKVNSNIAQ